MVCFSNQSVDQKTKLNSAPHLEISHLCLQYHFHCSCSLPSRVPILAHYIQSLISLDYAIPDPNLFLISSNPIFRQFFPLAIPKYIKLNFYNNVQLFSNHGHFLEYLSRFSLADPPLCPYGNGSQSSFHLLTSCTLKSNLKTQHINNLAQFVSTSVNYQRFLSDHGHFAAYLARFGLSDSDECPCGCGLQMSKLLLTS